MTLLEIFDKLLNQSPDLKSGDIMLHDDRDIIDRAMDSLRQSGEVEDIRSLNDLQRPHCDLSEDDINRMWGEVKEST